MSSLVVAFVAGAAVVVLVLAAAARLGAASALYRVTRRKGKGYAETRRRIDESDAAIDDGDVDAVREWLRRRAER